MKRKRGGQKGNQNARTHGFYSRVLNVACPELCRRAGICEFWNIANLEGVDPEIAVLRVKLRSSLQHAPANPRLIKEASKLLAKWYSAKYQLDRTDSNHLTRVIKAILDPGSSLCEPHQPVRTDR